MTKLLLTDYQEKVWEQEKIIQENPDKPKKIVQAHVNLCRLYKGRKKYNHAIRSCQEIINKSQEPSVRKKAYLELIEIYKIKKDSLKVKEVGELLVQEFPDDSSVVQIKLDELQALENNKKYAKCIQGYGEFLSYYPRIKNADFYWFKMALYSLKLGDVQTAQEMYSQTLWRADKAKDKDSEEAFWLKAQTIKGDMKYMQARKITQAPTIDGRLNDTSWEKAEKVTGYVATHKDASVTQQTISSVVYDKDNLYIAFKCLEKNIVGLVAKESISDKAKVWSDDCIEFFFVPGDLDIYYQIIVTPREICYDAFKREPPKWNPQYDVATAIGQNYWNVEIAIPFREIDVNTPQTKMNWRINFNRARRAGEKEISGWAFMDGSHHQPERFGYLTFE